MSPYIIEMTLKKKIPVECKTPLSEMHYVLRQRLYKNLMKILVGTSVENEKRIDRTNRVILAPSSLFIPLTSHQGTSLGTIIQRRPSVNDRKVPLPANPAYADLPILL